MARPLLASSSLPLLDVGAFKPDHHRHADTNLPDRGDHTLGDQIAPYDATKNLFTRIALTPWLEQDQLECLGHALGSGTAADIEEVGGVRRHGA